MDDAVPGQVDPVDRPPSGADAEAGAPQLRTILLTDICDSIALVERLGDGSAANFFREHDRLVLTLQQRWRGRLIDRSDGLLLLFERPIDGLGFALDYTRGLAEMGSARNLDLRSRAGLHVGEVLTWRNSDEAVRVGSKPVEVEGLAKPIAARLMSMALPGQILMSAVAEPLAHRAARELGERGQSLIWKPMGRWRFKGVPESQEIFEVGEAGVAPLRMPPSTPKAWRDLPLWRRPAALVAQAAVLALVCVGAWFTTRPAPAIAFGERDWVVVGDLRNLTGQPLLDESLEQAFRISLEQSRFVNVLSDLKTRDTLGRMQLPADTPLDRGVASELALRDGARAVILPTVSEVGGRLRVSAEVVDPHTQGTVYVESADGSGMESALASIDEVTGSLRERLGEALGSIDEASVPLPDVTTDSIDALRAYALAQQAYSRRESGDAMRLFERATQLDPDFALAWLGQMRVLYAIPDAPAAVQRLRRAQSLRQRLAPREALYMDAWAARFDDPASATGKWQELAQLYPDYGPALSNAAIWLYGDNRFEQATEFAKAAAAPPHADVAVDLDSLGRSHLALGQYREAADAFEHALRLGYRSSARRRAAVAAAGRDFESARALVADLPMDNLHNYLEIGTIAVDESRWADAEAASRAGMALAPPGSFSARLFLVPMAVAQALSGDRKGAIASARRAAELSVSLLGSGEQVQPDGDSDAEIALTSALLALRLGDQDLAGRVVAEVSSHDYLTAIPRVAELLTVVQAEQARVSGSPEAAIGLLRPLLTGRERYQTRVALEAALRQNGDVAEAQQQREWLQRHRGLAYAETTCGSCSQALNVADSNGALGPAARFNQSATTSE